MGSSLTLTPQIIALFIGALAMTIVMRRMFRGTRRRGTSVYVGPTARARQRAAELQPKTVVEVEGWAQDRPVCPCCRYATNWGTNSVCVICDWEEPLAERPEWGVDVGDRAEELAAAQERFRTTGSSLTPEERAETPEPQAGEQMLKRRLLERLEYLRSADRPDASEAWEDADRLLAQLRSEVDRRLAP